MYLFRGIKLKRFQCVFLVFAFLVFYFCCAIIQEMESVLYGFYLVDYSVGFCTKLLPGAIYNALFSSTDATSIRMYTMTLFFAFLMGLSFCIVKFATSFDKDLRPKMLIFSLVLVCGISSVTFCGKYLEMLDTYWLLFALIMLSFVRNKYLKWCIPILLIVSILVHMASAVFIMPFFVVILLLENSAKSENRGAIYTIVSVSIAVSVLLAIYFVLNEENNILMSIDEFHEFMSKRNTELYEYVTYYYDYSLYKTHVIDGAEQISANFSEYILFDSENIVAKFLNTLYSQLFLTVNIYKASGEGFPFKLLVSCLPIVILLYSYGVTTIKNNKENKLRVFALIAAFVAFPMEFFVLLLFSPDIVRWFSHTFTVMFAVMLYDMYLYKDVKYKDNKNWVYSIAAYFVFYVFYAAKYVQM